jgi:putative endonuclease
VKTSANVIHETWILCELDFRNILSIAMSYARALQASICFMNNEEHKITEKRKTGNLGEDIACKYLEKAGFTIKDRNYLRKYGEIDIVAMKSRVIHFVEVKSVTRNVIHETSDKYRPEDNMHPWKLKRLARTIQAYILDKKVGDDWQFDVITVVLNMKTRRAKIEFMENIVL